VKADVTVTFHAAKTGLANARKYVGELVISNIGLPHQLANYAGPGDVLFATKKRNLTAHKGDFGRVLAIGGSEVFSGAPTLVSFAALRTGVDIVYLAAPSKTAIAISSMSPDLITVKLDGGHLKSSNIEELKPYIAAVDAVVLGPGLGMHNDTKEFVMTCIEAVEAAGKPLLLDADGLKAFADSKRPFKVPAVLTPHAGEYAILTNRELPENTNEKVVLVQKTAAELNCIVLVKGKVDIICSKRRFKLNLTGNPGMTVGGTGDVLSGIIGAFLAQKTDPFEAAVAGAFVNGAAGDFAANQIGYHLIASDLLDWIPHVLNNPISHVEVRQQSG
jgi:NAD(P)H-hydrate epimerase